MWVAEHMAYADFEILREIVLKKKKKNIFDTHSFYRPTPISKKYFFKYLENWTMWKKLFLHIFELRNSIIIENFQFFYQFFTIKFILLLIYTYDNLKTYINYRNRGILGILYFWNFLFF